MEWIIVAVIASFILGFRVGEALAKIENKHYEIRGVKRNDNKDCEVKMLRELLAQHNAFVQKIGYHTTINNPISQAMIKENLEKDYTHWLKVCKNIASVEINKTGDTSETVLEFTSHGGEKASLWLNGNRIRAITPY